MNLYIRRAFLVALLLTPLFLCYQLFASLRGTGQEIIYNPDNLTVEQLQLETELLETNRSQMSPAGSTNSGQLLYNHPDGHLTTQLPSGFDGETERLTRVQQRQIAASKLVESPFWMFWSADQIPVGEYNSSTSGLSIGLGLAITAGLLYGLSAGLTRELGPFLAAGLVFWCLFELSFLESEGLMLGLMFGLLYWPTFGLTFTLMYRLAFIVRSYWFISNEGTYTANGS